MNTRTTPAQLVSKRTFAHRQAALQQKHAWVLKDKPLEIRPGWFSILDATLDKIKSILTEEDIAFSRLEFLYTDTRSQLKIFMDGEKLSRARFNAVDHLINAAAQASEMRCPKCGGKVSRSFSQRYSSTCEAHREYEGDFAEDHRRYQTMLKKAEATAAAQAIKEKGEAEAQEKAAEQEIGATVSMEIQDGEHFDPSLPTLHVYDIEDVQKVC